MMKIQNYEIFKLQANLCSIMANPKRLAIFEVLSEREVSVGEIAEKLDLSISTISQHLRLMKDKNIVSSRKSGQTVFYKLKNPKLIEACHLIREVLTETLKDNWDMAKIIEGKN